MTYSPLVKRLIVDQVSVSPHFYRKGLHSSQSYFEVDGDYTTITTVGARHLITALPLCAYLKFLFVDVKSMDDDDNLRFSIGAFDKDKNKIGTEWNFAKNVSGHQDYYPNGQRDFRYNRKDPSGSGKNIGEILNISDNDYELIYFGIEITTAATDPRNSSLSMDALYT